jgi:uncharacterized protein
MLIRVKDLEVRKIDFDEEFQPGDVELGPDIRQVEPLRTKGRAELIREHHGGQDIVEDIRLVGKLDGGFEVNCARCLEPVRQQVSCSFDLLYRPEEATKGSDEVSISESETEIGFYTGEGMELEDSLREQVLLAVPVKVICRPDCKGLCPHCGKNLNQESCGCSTKAEDPRWNALRELRDKL